MKLMNLVLENENDWFELLKTELDPRIRTQDNHGNELSITCIFDTSSKKINIFPVLTIKNGTEIPDDIYKTVFDECVKRIKDTGTVPEDNDLKLWILAFNIHTGSNHIDVGMFLPIYTYNRIRGPKKYNDLITPGSTDFFILEPNVIPTFEPNFKEKSTSVENKSRKIYQGLKSGSFNGQRYVLPDNYVYSTTNPTERTSETDNVIRAQFTPLITVWVDYIQYPGGMTDELKEYLIKRFEQFDITLTIY